MARYPEDRYESYAAFIEQLEDAKRRITDPAFHEKQKEEKEVEILGTPGGAKYKMWLIIAMVAIVVIVAGLLVWKGSSLLHQNNAPPPELNDYTPKSSSGAKPSH
jgi:hypothetical protein